MINGFRKNSTESTKKINVNTFQIIPQNKTWRNNCVILFIAPQQQQHLNDVKTQQRKIIDENS